jgi:hypothetical protein
MKQNRRQTRLPRIDIQSVSGYDTFRKRALSVANTTYAYHASKHAARGLLEMLLHLLTQPNMYGVLVLSRLYLARF